MWDYMEIQSGIHVQRNKFGFTTKIPVNEWIFICFKLNKMFNFLNVRMASDIWIATLEAKGQKRNSFKTLGGNHFHTRSLYPGN